MATNGQAALQSAALAPIDLTPVELLRIAVEQNASIDQLTKLMDLQERWERREAKRAYDAAMKAFKADPPRITKNKSVHYEPKDTARNRGAIDYKHATLDHVCDSIIGALSRVGVSHRWKVAQAADGWITVTCILTHELGHAEDTSLMGCADNSGSKNPVQAIGSTVTYLQRYTLLAATGLATSDQDDDGRTASADEGLSDERLETLGSAIANARSLGELKTLYFAAYREAQTAKDATAKQLFMRTKDARKRELQ